MTYFKRELETPILAFLASDADQIILLSGARQTGKSTLIENLNCNKQKLFINLWDEQRETLALRNAATFSEFEHILKTVFHFVPNGSQILAIDEAQSSEHLSSFIMEMHRTWRNQKVILSGSLLANLFAKGKPVPTGRTVEFICRPLNFKEFLSFRKKEAYLDLVQGNSFSEDIHNLLMDEYIIFLQIGGLPGMVTASQQGQNLHLLFDSFLNQTFKDADRYIHMNESPSRSRVPQFGRILETVMKSIANHIASPTQNSTLLSTDSPAYREILPLVLEAVWAWHLGYLLPYQTAQHSTKKGYSSKKYVFDTGIANFLLTRLMPVQFGDGNQTTAMLLENGVLQDCISQVESITAIECYRTNNKTPTELDFIVSLPNRKLAIEVKSSTEVKRQTLNQLVDYLVRSDSNNGIVLYTGLPRTEEINGKTIHFIPPYKLLQMFKG